MLVDAGYLIPPSERWTTLSHKGVANKHIMAYTGHKSSTSLVHYDNLDYESGTHISNMLIGVKIDILKAGATPCCIYYLVTPVTTTSSVQFQLKGR